MEKNINKITSQNKTLPELLEEYRKAKGLTKEALGAEIGVGAGTLYDLLDPQKVSKCSVKTLKKVAIALEIPIEKVIASQDLLKLNNLIPTEKEIESGERKLSICTSCYKTEVYEDEDERVFKILCPTYYSDSDYDYCVECGSKLESFCKRCNKPIVSLEHKHCPYCGYKYDEIGGIKCKECKKTIKHSVINSKIEKCPYCSCVFPLNLEFSDKSNIEDFVYSIYADVSFHTSKDIFLSMYPPYEINPELNKSELVSKELLQFCIECTNNLNTRWKWKASEYTSYGSHDYCGKPSIILTQDRTEEFMCLPSLEEAIEKRKKAHPDKNPAAGFKTLVGLLQQKPDWALIEGAKLYGLFDYKPFTKRLALQAKKNKKSYDVFDFLKLCRTKYKETIPF